MIDPVTSRPPGSLWVDYESGNEIVKPSSIVLKEKEEAARKQANSYYYMTTLQSLKAAVDDTSHVSADKGDTVSTAKKNEKTLYQRFTTWVWGVFGYKAEEPETFLNPLKEESRRDDSLAVVSQSPKLQPPEPMTRERLTQHIATLNKELFHRLKETAEFEEEMRKSNSKKMDKLIVFHIIQRSLEQRKLKEGASIGEFEEVMKLQDFNSDLSKKHYQILDEINSAAKTNDILHWVNIGSTVGIAGMILAGFATGGASMAFYFTFSALNLLKGGLTAAEGIMKYKIDFRKGEITMVEHQARKNRKAINDKVTATQNLNDEISEGLKAIRDQIDIYNQHFRQLSRFT